MAVDLTHVLICSKNKKLSSPDFNPFPRPNCIIKMNDLGIALGSAVKTASLSNVDNRIMHTAGVSALSLGLLERCSMVYGIPLKGSGKNIFSDRFDL